MRRTNVSKRAVFSALTVGLLCGTAVPAYAQDTSGDDADDEAPVVLDTAEPVVNQGDSTIVVVGSRIRRDTFTTSSPIDVITREDIVFSGASATSEVLQSTAVTSGTAQINDTFLGYVSEGGPGANTLGLRGLGAGRTLVLLNGRRLAPAGAGPELIAADLNVLPAAIVQRTEILREGASSIYGSDAVAGVVNVVTDTEYDGVTLDFYTNQPLKDGGARTYRAAVIAGETFDKGYITGSFEFRRRTGLRYNERGEDYTCPRDLFVDPATGNEVGQLIPGTNQVRCHPFQYGSLGTAQNYMLGFSFESGAVDRFTYLDGDINTIYNVNDYDVRPTSSPVEDMEHLISPLDTYTGFLSGAYEITPSVEIYGEALFTRRESRQERSSQISIDPNQLGDEEWGGDFVGTPLEAYGYSVSPFFPDVVAGDPNVLFDGYNLLRVFIVPPLLTFEQNVNFFRANGGLRGDVGVGDLRFDVNVQHSRTDSTYFVEGIDSRKFAAALDPVIAPAGTPEEFVTMALPGQAGAGNSYTCAENVDTGGNFISGSTCVPANIFAPSFLAGDIPENVLGYLYDNFENSTDFHQTTIQAVVDGTLLDLPAGPLGFALGFEHREDYINDVPSEASQTSNLYNFSSSGITTGKDKVNEIFGEVAIPVLRDQPFFYDLSLSASGRWTDYKSYGSDFTYQFGGEWAPVPEFRVRGSYGTSFRAPNLFEQFVAGQTGFFGAGSDPCDDFANVWDPGDPVYDNCLAAVGAYLNNDLDNDGTFDNFIATSGPQVITEGGAGLLEAETSTSWGVGGVLDLSLGEATDFALAVDYFSVKVKDQVSQLGSDILDFCYEDPTFDNRYCDLIAPRETAQGNLDFFRNPYINVAQQSAKGIDFTSRFATDLFGGGFSATLRSTRMLKQITQDFPDDEPFNANGLLGYNGTTGGPKWSGQLDMRFTTADDRWTFRWGIDYIGKMDTESELSNANPTVRGIDVDVDLIAERYWEHGFSIQYRMPDVAQFTLGVNNVFDTKPSIIGTYTAAGNNFPRVGNYFNYSGYDFIGRSLFVNVTTDF